MTWLRTALFFLPAVGALSVASLGCNALLDLGSFSIAADAGPTDSGPPHKQKDATSPGTEAGRSDAGRDGTSGDGLSRRDGQGAMDGGGDHQAPKGDSGPDCPTPTDRPSFESACTGATCVGFMESRVSFEAGRPFPEAGSVPDAAPAGDAGIPTYPACPTSNVVYATGSTALSVFLGDVAEALSGSISFVYQGTGSCFGVQAMLQPGYLMTGAATMYTASAPSTCSLPAGGVPVDIGISDVFASTCQELTNGLPPSIQENYGPVQVMTFAVPATSSQESISLAAAYNVFGFGSQSGVAPWTDANYILQRNASSGTQNMIAALIGVPAASWQGVMNATTAGVLGALVADGKDDAGIPDKTIGILVAGSADTNRSSIHVLAFQDNGQSCGYFPDTTSASHDKYNVRNGHYPIWGPSHFYNRVDSSGPLNANAQTFINDLSGITPLPGIDLLTLYAQNSVIPLCAMHVTRASDGANYTPYTPVTSCSCYYDLQATGATSCTPCMVNGDCTQPGAKVCHVFNNIGYCEPE